MSEKGSVNETMGYPCAGTTISDETYSNLSYWPDGTKMTVAWFRTHVWPHTASFHIPRDGVLCGMQANMFHIVLTSSTNESYTVIAKRIVPKELPGKANVTLWNDFLASVKREIHFYKDLLLQTSNSKDVTKLFPRVFYSDGRHVLDEDDPVGSASFLLLMEDVSKSYSQSCSMNKSQAESLMASLATLHADYWHTLDSDDERGTFWTLERRRPLQEVENADATWNSIVDRFPEFLTLVPNCRRLAGKLTRHAQYLDDFVDGYAVTRVHGDCKGWNLFFNDDANVVFIDMQWSGKGHPLQDVAYALTTTLEADLLQHMDYFVDIYVEQLKKELSDLGKDDLPGDFRSHFDLVWLDYVRVIMTGLWKRFSPQQIEMYKDVVGPSMITKSRPHAAFIIKRVHRLLNIDKVLS